MVWVVIEGYFVVPVIIGRSMEMNATTVMLACLFWKRRLGRYRAVSGDADDRRSQGRLLSRSRMAALG